jgi:hypothetical protein
MFETAARDQPSELNLTIRQMDWPLCRGRWHGKAEAALACGPGVLPLATGREANAASAE